MKGAWLTASVAGLLAFGAAWLFIGRDGGTAGDVEEEAGVSNPSNVSPGKTGQERIEFLE